MFFNSRRSVEPVAQDSPEEEEKEEEFIQNRAREEMVCDLLRRKALAGAALASRKDETGSRPYTDGAPGTQGARFPLASGGDATLAVSTRGRALPLARAPASK